MNETNFTMHGFLGLKFLYLMKTFSSSQTRCFRGGTGFTVEVSYINAFFIEIPVPDQIKTIQAIEPGNRCPHMCVCMSMGTYKLSVLNGNISGASAPAMINVNRKM